MATSNIQVIDRTVSVLDVLMRYSSPVRLKVVSAETGLNVATAHRILNALVANALVRKVGSGEYQVEAKLFRLYSHRSSNAEIIKSALPIMKSLRDQVGTAINLAVREGDSLKFIHCELPSQNLLAYHPVNSLAALHTTSIGKLILGFEGRDAILKYCERTNIRKHTPNSVQSVEALVDESIMSYRRGYGCDEQENELGVCCIGSLIFDDSGFPAAGLSASSSSLRFDAGWADRIVTACAQIEQTLKQTKHNH